MNIQIDMDGIVDAQRFLELFPKETTVSAVSAMNRAITAGRTQLSKGIREKYIIRAADIKGTLSTKKATSGNMQASVSSEGRPIELIKFKVRKLKSGYFAQVKKGGGGRLPHSFFVSVGKAGLYHRETSSRLPIQREFGPSIPKMASDTNVSATVEKRIQEVFQARFAHEMGRRTGGIV